VPVGEAPTRGSYPPDPRRRGLVVSPRARRDHLGAPAWLCVPAARGWRARGLPVTRSRAPLAQLTLSSSLPFASGASRREIRRRSSCRRGELCLPRFTLRLSHVQVAKPSPEPRHRPSLERLYLCACLVRALFTNRNTVLLYLISIWYLV
jgi:hypothetical protein